MVLDNQSRRITIKYIPPCRHFLLHCYPLGGARFSMLYSTSLACSPCHRLTRRQLPWLSPSRGGVGLQLPQDEQRRAAPQQSHLRCAAAQLSGVVFFVPVVDNNSVFTFCINPVATLSNPTTGTFEVFCYTLHKPPATSLCSTPFPQPGPFSQTGSP